MGNMNDNPIRPGEFLRDHLRELRWTQKDLASIMGRTPAAINEIIMGRRSITIQTARELSAALGETAQFWMNLETAYQLAWDGKSVLAIERRAAAFRRASRPRESRGTRMVRAFKSGMSRQQVARKFKVSIAQVDRAIKKRLR